MMWVTGQGDGGGEGEGDGFRFIAVNESVGLGFRVVGSKVAFTWGD